MEDNQEEIIKTYEESFVEEYDKWRGIIEDVNKSIPQFIESVEFEVGEIEPFTYNEFCLEFLEHLKTLYENFPVLTKIGIYSIFESMILLKIANSADEPSSAIKSLLDE
jgi:hypothetical protein